MPADDGDIVRALGYVTLYSGHLEEAVDECAGVLGIQCDSMEYIQLSLMGKIRRCRERADVKPGFQELTLLLCRVAALAARRRHIVYDIIYGSPSVQTMLQAGSTGVAGCDIKSAELYDLAVSISRTAGQLMSIAWKGTGLIVKKSGTG